MKIKGYSLIELVIFIVIIAISISVLLPLFTILHNVSQIDHNTVALELAQQRIEGIISNREMHGFGNFTGSSAFDPCNGGTPPAYCTTPSGYTITSSIANGGGCAVTTNCRAVTVTVSGKGAGTLITLVTNY